MVTMETTVTSARARRIQSARMPESNRRCRSATPSCEKPVYQNNGPPRAKSRGSLHGYDSVPIVQRLDRQEETCMQRALQKRHENVTTSRIRAWCVRPVSAPLNAGSTRAARRVLFSARSKLKTAPTPTCDVTEDEETSEMHNVVKAVTEAKTFKDETSRNREAEKVAQEPEAEEKKDSAPVFNKRLFASQGTVIMTREARRLMNKNIRDNEVCDTDSTLTKGDIQCLRCVTEGLKLIHKSEDFVKDVLSRVITYEMYKAYEYVHPKSWEDSLSCYYILNGAVEVTYDLRNTASRNVYQANIIYSHGTGEYLGLVSPEGPTEDLAPPATIYTKELTQFIRVDRARFHAIMTKATQMVNDRKREFFSSRSFLVNVSREVKEKILHKFSIQDFPANRVLLAQGELTEYLFIIMSGRCQTYREVYIPEAEKDVLFYLTSRDPDDFFGEECILDREPSVCTVVTATATTCLKLHKSALQMVQRDRLARYIEEARHQFLPDSNLKDRGYNDSVWNRYKHGQVKESLKEGGKLQYLTNSTGSVVHDRPLQDDKMYMENMRRFVLNGSQFEPMRAQSAKTRKTTHRLPVRPKTAFQRLNSSEKQERVGPDNKTPSELEPEPEVNVNDSVPEASEEEPSPSSNNNNNSKLMTMDKAKDLEKKIAKALESKENLMKVLEEDVETGSQAKHAWKATVQQEQQNFIKNGVLVTMTSEDIVRKAKALADTYADKWKNNFAEENEEEWDTILHAENKQAKMLISANRMRIKDLKRKMAALQKQREKTRQRFAHSKRIPASMAGSDVDSVKRTDRMNRQSTDTNDTILTDIEESRETRASPESVVATETNEGLSDNDDSCEAPRNHCGTSELDVVE